MPRRRCAMPQSRFSLSERDFSLLVRQGAAWSGGGLGVGRRGFDARLGLLAIFCGGDRGLFGGELLVTDASFLSDDLPSTMFDGVVKPAEEEADDDASYGCVEDTNFEALPGKKGDGEGEKEPDEPAYEREKLHFG